MAEVIEARWKRVDRVRRGVGDALAGIDDEHAVAHSGRLLDRSVVVDEGEQPVGDHDRQPFEELEIDPLERSPAPGRAWRPDSAEDTENSASVAHGDMGDAHETLGDVARLLAADDRSGSVSLDHVRQLLCGLHLADEIDLVQGLARRRPDLAEDDEGAEIPDAGLLETRLLLVPGGSSPPAPSTRVAPAGVASAPVAGPLAPSSDDSRPGGGFSKGFSSRKRASKSGAASPPAPLSPVIGTNSSRSENEKSASRLQDAMRRSRWRRSARSREV